MLSKIPLSWDEFSRDAHILLEHLQDFLQKNTIACDENFRLLVPCRGGEILGSLAKNFLWLSESQVVRIKFSNTDYEAEKMGIMIRSDAEKRTFENLILDENVKNIVFLDDLLDTGGTIRFIREKFSQKNIIIGTLYYKEEKSDISLLNLPARKLPNVWIDFPWEAFYKK